MAVAAENLIALTWLEIGFLVVASGLAWFAYKENRKATKAARDAVDVERRPWVTTKVRRDEHDQIYVQFLNHGRSPAMIRETDLYRVNARGLPRPCLVIETRWRGVPYGALIPSGGPSQRFTVRSIRSAVEGNHPDEPVRHYVTGYILFDDLWGARYIHGFCYVAHADGNFYFAGEDMWPGPGPDTPTIATTTVASMTRTATPPWVHGVGAASE
jgi:hypothetical protein